MATTQAGASTTPRRRHPILKKAQAGALTASNRIGARLLPVLPDAAKRLMMGGRTIAIDGNTLDPTAAMFLASMRRVGIQGFSDGNDPAIVRRRNRETVLIFDREIVAVGGVTDLSIPGPAGPIPARHYRPETGQASALMVYYHGGAWVFGDLDMFDRFCSLMCRDAGIPVLSVDYRLAPEHPAPAGLEDAYTAFRWALEHCTELGAEPGRVAVGGDSAGGNFAAVVSQRGRDDGTPPVLQLLLYPITDMRGGTRSHALFSEGFLLTRKDMDLFHGYYLDGSGLEITDPRISPLLADDLSGLPPAIVVTAGFDPLRDEGERYAAAMRDAGTVVDLRRKGSLIHAFINLASLGGGAAIAVAETISAVRAHLCHL